MPQSCDFPLNGWRCLGNHTDVVQKPWLKHKSNNSLPSSRRRRDGRSYADS